MLLVAALFVAGFAACGETPAPSEEPILPPPRDSGTNADASTAIADANDDGAVEPTGEPCTTPKAPCGDAGALCLLSKRCGMPRAAGAACGASWECASGRCDSSTKTCVTDPNACGIFFDGCADRACCSGLRCVDLAASEKRCELCEVAGVACPEDAGPSGCCSGTCANGLCQ